jgi:hypothetical protein
MSQLPHPQLCRGKSWALGEGLERPVAAANGGNSSLHVESEVERERGQAGCDPSGSNVRLRSPSEDVSRRWWVN